MTHRIPAEGLIAGLDMVRGEIVEIEGKLAEGETDQARELSIWLRHRLTAVSAAVELVDATDQE